MVYQVIFFLIPNQNKMTIYFDLQTFFNPKEPKSSIFIAQQISTQTNKKTDGLRPKAHQISLKK